MIGTVFDNKPTYGDNPTARKRGQPAKQQGDYWVGGYEDRHTPDDTPGEVQGDGPTGTLTSPFFKITGRYITFLVGGGCDANLIHADLIIDGVVRNNVVRALIFFLSQSRRLLHFLACCSGFCIMKRLRVLLSSSWMGC